MKRANEMWKQALLGLAAWGISVSVSGFSLYGDAHTLRVIREDGSFLIFTQNGKVTVTKPGTVDVFLVGGGGGGGKGNTKDSRQGGGGGGGGGVVSRETVSVSAGTYDVVIGAGGAVSENGGSTSVFGLVAYGGGGGADYGGHAGNDGASGGGATFADSEARSGGAAVYGGDAGNLGCAGGNATHLYGAGGGGGAGTAATPNSDRISFPGYGGDGVNCAFFSTGIWYGGGGAGYRSDQLVAGGKGGGGSCLKSVSEPGTDGLGGGGCGGSHGGSGTVIIRFVPTKEETFSEDFCMTGGDEIFLSEEESIHVFRNDGTISVTGSGLVDLLAVGGGGGGGAGADASSTLDWGVAGGGGGGVVYVTNAFVRSGTYTVTVGAGGAVSENGGDSVVFGFQAFGGGAGGDMASQSAGRAGNAGGSGGGSTFPMKGSDVTWTNVLDGGAAAYVDWGNAGHAGGRSGHVYAAGGGGGAGAPGELHFGSSPGSGGDGLPVAITGRIVYYGGGGTGYRSGWSSSQAEGKGLAGGKGGGGDFGLPGEDGLGGGGSGTQPGGKGIVVIRYRKSTWKDEFKGATGGTFVKKGRYGIHTFAENGTFTMPCAGKVDVLLVGGGGGGGSDSSDDKFGGGGGGGGGVVLTNRILAAGAYAVGVGQGGAVSENGGASTLFGMTAYGGGAGADGVPYPAGPGTPGNDGATGGGATHKFEINTDVEGTAVVVYGGQAIYGDAGNLGYAGGHSKHVYAPGGGGGAGAPGGNSNGTTPGAGGAGVMLSISGADVYYGGGGAGFRDDKTVAGGVGGGGSCLKSVSEPGTDGLGGGGCGGSRGGNGVVVIRYLMPNDGALLIVR